MTTTGKSSPAGRTAKPAPKAAAKQGAQFQGALGMARRLFRAVLPHLCLIMCFMLLVFFVIDQVNAHIGFMKNEFHKWLTLFLCLTAIAESAMLIALNRKRKLLEAKRRAAGRQKSAK